MLPAKKGLVYSPQDVIDAIQNVESAIKMESDDTEEEENKDFSEVDKENRHSPDCPHGDYVDFDLTKLSRLIKQAVSLDRYRWLKKEFIKSQE